MENNNVSRLKWLTVRLNENEYAEAKKLWKLSTARTLSDYARSVVLRKPVTVKYRNITADALLSEIVALRKEFKAVGFNFNQVVHKLHLLKEIPDFKIWLTINERHKDALFQKIKEIQDKINSVYTLWSKDFPHPDATSEK